jgi:hypothetical protein
VTGYWKHLYAPLPSLTLKLIDHLQREFLSDYYFVVCLGMQVIVGFLEKKSNWMPQVCHLARVDFFENR